jgi:hypothetical protein
MMAVLLVLAVLVVVALVQILVLVRLELQTQVEVVEADINNRLRPLVAAQAAQVSSSLNTSPNLITKSSNHQAHGLHLVALLRSST